MYDRPLVFPESSHKPSASPSTLDDRTSPRRPSRPTSSASKSTRSALFSSPAVLASKRSSMLLPRRSSQPSPARVSSRAAVLLSPSSTPSSLSPPMSARSRLPRTLTRLSARLDPTLVLLVFVLSVLLLRRRRLLPRNRRINLPINDDGCEDYVGTGHGAGVVKNGYYDSSEVLSHVEVGAYRPLLVAVVSNENQYSANTSSSLIAFRCNSNRCNSNIDEQDNVPQE